MYLQLGHTYFASRSMSRPSSDELITDSANDAAMNGAASAAASPKAGDDGARTTTEKSVVLDPRRISTALGEICALLPTLPRYRHLPLQDLEWMIMAPLLKNQIALARLAFRKGEEKRFVGGVIWAKVSPEVDRKIRDQIRDGTFPIRLQREDWTSGDITWILDVLAPTRKVATKIFSEIESAGLGGAKKLNAHPIVQQLIDAELLAELGAAAVPSKAPAG